MEGIFISCVSREFHGDTAPGAGTWPLSYRHQLAQFLQTCGQHVVYQETFAQGQGDLLAKLEDYIGRECKAVIHLIGHDEGWSPDDDLPEGSQIPSDAIHSLLLRHGDNFLAERPSLRKRLVDRGFRGISATQWEAYLALHYNKPLLVFTFADEAQRAPSFPIELIEQVIHRAHSLPNRPCGSSISHLVERLTTFSGEVSEVSEDIFQVRKPTRTCLAIGPDDATKIDLVTGHLELL